MAKVFKGEVCEQCGQPRILRISQAEPPSATCLDCGAWYHELVPGDLTFIGMNPMKTKLPSAPSKGMAVGKTYVPGQHGDGTTNIKNPLAPMLGHAQEILKSGVSLEDVQAAWNEGN